jgi:hypothetical protein
VRTTQEREELTVTIATAMFLLVVIVAAGAGAAIVVDRLGAGHGVVVFLVLATVVLAAVVSLRYLVRHGYPT